MDLVAKYYAGEEDAADVLKSEGVTHAAVFKCVHDESVCLSGSVVYENEDIKIIDLNQEVK